MYLAIILFIIALSILFFFFIRKKFFHLEIKKSLNYQLFLITIPRDFSLIEQEKQKTFIDFVSVFEQALESLSRYKKEIIFEIAVHNSSQEICFYAACFKKDSEFFEKTLSSLFPYAVIEPCLLYTSPSPRDGLLSRMPS